MLGGLKKYRDEKKEFDKYSAVYDKYKGFTMVTREDCVKFLSLLSNFKKVSGSVVECGVWRGGMSAAMVDVMGKERNYYLFDSFEGLPPAKEIDGKSAMAWQKDVKSPGYYDNCKAEMEWAEKAMKTSGAKNYKLVKGWFDSTVPTHKFDEPIAILRLDGDWYDSTMVCLENLFPKVAEGGLIILDDYYVWDGCAKALHDYLSKNKRAERITQAYSSGCYLVKK
jgi:O-methyltransferase